MNNIQDPPYRKKVYDILSSGFSDFKTTEQDFYNKLDSDPEYAGKVFDVISSNFSDFKRPKNEFLDLLSPVKKKDGTIGGIQSTQSQFSLLGPKDQIKQQLPFFQPIFGATQKDKSAEVNSAREKIKGVISESNNIFTDIIREERLAEFERQQQSTPSLDNIVNPSIASARKFLLTQDIVKPEEIDIKRQQAMSDPIVFKKVVSRAAQRDPEVAKSAYILDAESRLEEGPDRANKIYSNAQKILDGSLTYNTRKGILQEPKGVIESAINGFRERGNQLDIYEKISNAKDDKEAIDILESEMVSIDPETPMPIASGSPAVFAEMFGTEGVPMIKSSVAGIVTSLIPGGQGVAPYVAAFASSPEYYKRSYASAIKATYYELRKKGKSPEESLAIAKDQANKEGLIGAAEGIVSTALGAKIGFKAPPVSSSPLMQNAIQKVLTSSANAVRSVVPEAATDAAAAGLLQITNNLAAIDNGLDRGVLDGVQENIAGEVTFTIGIGALTKGGRALIDRNTYKSILNTFSRQPKDIVDAKIGEMVVNGDIAPDDALEVGSAIEKERSLDSQIPSGVQEIARPVITDLIEIRDDLKSQLQSSNEAFHPQIKEQIKSIDNQILNYATQESAIQEGLQQGSVVQPTGVEEGQPEVGQAEGTGRQATQPEANVGDRTVSGEGQVKLDPVVISQNSAPLVAEIKSATPEIGTGSIMNLDGTQYTGGGLVVPAASMNTTIEEITPEMVSNFINENRGKLSSDIFKAGLYKFPNSNRVSIDLNIVVPRENRDIAIEFGRMAGQESLFDLDTYENIKTGADGLNPVSFTDDQFREIADALSKNRMPNVFETQKAISESEGQIGSALSRSIDKASQSLQKTGMKYVVVDPTTDTEEAAAARGNQGLFRSSDGTIIIDKSKLANEIEAGLVVWHESAHPVMNIIRNTDKPLYDAVVRGLEGAARQNTGIARAINWAQKNYSKNALSESQGRNVSAREAVEVQNDEAIVEIIARINEGIIDINTIEPGFLQKIIDFINSVAAAIGIDPIIDPTDIEQFKRTVSAVSSALKEGRDIAEVVGEENVGQFKNNVDTESSFINQDVQARFMTEFFEDSDLFNKLIEDGFIIHNSDLSTFKGNTVVIHNPDSFATGKIKFRDKDLVDGEGGIYFTLKYGDFWASSKENTAKQMASLINESLNRSGKARLVLVKGDPSKNITSIKGAKALMGVIEILSNDGLIPLSAFRKALISAGKKYKINFNGRNDAKSIHSDIQSKFMNVSQSSFEKRGDFVRDVIDEIAKQNVLSKDDIAEIAKSIGAKRKMTTFSKASIIDSVSYATTERILRDVPNSHAYAIIETESPVEIKKDGRHESYPWHIKTKDGSRPILYLLKERPFFNDVFVAAKDTEKVKSGERFNTIDRAGLAQRGMGLAMVEYDTQASVGNRDIINGFYSPIEDRINTFKQPKASVQKWKDIVGMKSDEAVFSGMSDWLNSQKPDAQLSKQDVLNFMKDNRIEIKEVEIGDPSEADIEAFMNDEAGEGYTREEAIEYLRGDEGATKYSQYQLPGGENYKEVLITVPNIAEKKYNDYKLQLIGKYGSDFKNKDLTSDEFDALFDLNEARKNSRDFKSSHFDEPNIITHLRMNTRTDADGKKVLFLEEVQSDWGQKGKRVGFDDVNRDKLLDKENQLRESIWNHVNRKYQDIAENITLNEFINSKNAESWFYIENYTESDSILDRLWEDLKLTKSQIGNIKKISPAPYVTNTNAWVKLGLKVALKEAVKQGADRIAWTTGEQQNERYDLSKQVDEIDAKRNKDGSYEVTATKDGSSIFGRSDMSIKDIEDTFGKDVAEKIDSSESRLINISGENLKAGGKGMKAFYGDAKNTGIVGNVAKALVKELTGKEGSTVESVINTGGKLPNEMTVAEIQAAGGVDAVKASNANSIQPAIDITPELAQSVQQGMPQFSVGNREEDILRRKPTGPERKRAMAERIEGQPAETVSKINKDALTYFQQTNKQTEEQVREFMKGKDMESLADYVVSDPQIPDVSLVWMAATVAKELKPMIEAARETNPDLARRLSEKQAAIYNQFAVKATELGQAVQAFVAFKGDKDATQFYLNKIISKLVNDYKIDVTDEQIAEIESRLNLVSEAKDGRPKNEAMFELGRYLNSIVPIKAIDILEATWYAKILSGVTTQATNAFANIFNTSFEVPLVALRESIRTNSIKPALYALKGSASGFVKGSVKAADIIKSGVREQDMNKYFGNNVLEYFSWGRTKVGKLAGGRVGKFLDLPVFIEWSPRALKYVGRGLAAVDAMFSSVNQDAYANMLAWSMAAEEKKTDPTVNEYNRANEILGNAKDTIDKAKQDAKDEGLYPGTVAYKSRVIELVDQSRPKDIERMAEEFGKKVTLNYEPDGFTKPMYDAIVAAQRKFRVLKLFIPFTRILSNLTEQMVNYSPLSYYRVITGQKNPLNKEKGSLTNQERADLAIRATTGMAAMAILAMKAGDDEDDWFEITANGTDNIQKNYELEKEGWRPFTITFKNGVKMSYANWPIRGVLSAIGNYRDALKYDQAEDTWSNRITISTFGALSTMYDGSLMKGLSEFMDAVQPDKGGGYGDAPNNVAKWSIQQAKSVVLSNFTQQMLKFTDEYQGDPIKEAKGIAIIYRDIPVLNDGLNPIIDVFGDPVIAKTSERLSMWYSVDDDRKDAIISELHKKGVFVGIPKKPNIIDIANSTERPMNDEEYYRFRLVYGQLLKYDLYKNIEAIQQASPDDLSDAMSIIKKGISKAAKESVILGMKPEEAISMYIKNDKEKIKNP